MNGPSVSFIIPAYNEESYIERTLKTIKNQDTDVSYEIVVCDNNSTDKTSAIAKEYADIVVHEPKQGIPYARNKGFTHSTGKYLVHTDADTVFPRDFLERVYPIFESDKYVGFTCGAWDLCESKSLAWKAAVKTFSFAEMVLKKWMESRNVLILQGRCLCTPRKVFERVGGFPNKSESFEDTAYSLAIEPLGRKAFFPEIKVTTSTRRFEQGISKALNFYSTQSEQKNWLSYLYWALFRKTLFKPRVGPSYKSENKVNKILGDI